MKTLKFALPSFFLLGLSALAPAQSRWTTSLVAVNNAGYQFSMLDFQSSNDGSPTVASGTKSFSGLDRNGNAQTMTFTGFTQSSANYGRLKVNTYGKTTNNYYNASNPVYYNSSTGITDPNGSPDSLTALGFAGFSDVLQFGGSLQAGYRARYIFHVDGTNAGSGALADMSVTIAGNNETFFAFSSGYTNTIWATQSYEINGITPQTVDVQFSTQFVNDTWLHNDGDTVEGFSNFYSTLTLDHIDILDASGNLVTQGVTVSSASGTNYAVPEPATMLALGGGVLAMLRRRRKQA